MNVVLVGSRGGSAVGPPSGLAGPLRPDTVWAPAQTKGRRRSLNTLLSVCLFQVNPNLHSPFFFLNGYLKECIVLYSSTNTTVHPDTDSNIWAPQRQFHSSPQVHCGFPQVLPFPLPKITCVSLTEHVSIP